MRLHSLVLTLNVVLLFVKVFSSEDEERLMVDVFRGYNSLIPPIRNLSDMPLIVKVAMQLFLLINVAEKDQVMHTNVWLTLKWYDFQMRWNPVDYGEIREMRISPDKVWLPDIVLFNNADGNYEVSFMCNVVIKYQGDMLWVPPAIYKSSCIIDVEYFPFDEQVCTLVFGSWTYNENEIKLEVEHEMADLSEYEPSSIWDLIDAPAQLVKKRSQVEFQIRIRRKTLFYTIILIIPTVIMGTLNMAVFFLPTDSGEKITLTISIMLSIVVFLLLVSKILPPTSSTIPLMAKYLLLTFVLNVTTILITIVVINIYFRSPSTHRMPDWVRSVFIEVTNAGELRRQRMILALNLLLVFLVSIPSLALILNQWRTPPMNTLIVGIIYCLYAVHSAFPLFIFTYFRHDFRARLFRLFRYEKLRSTRNHSEDQLRSVAVVKVAHQ
ncbi:Nicotinic acetylcholine receptor non-alpha subunit [Trichostrongylus colubriformis]|uniref:Nicotinic acetylcholine receptor non-alpha subunit n=1 Tax=Trichostrongylus colubriformis TaxID=6319 RepID=A0AAN8FJK6_TRICO